MPLERFLALWVIGYGFIQAGVPEILQVFGKGDTIDGTAACRWAFVLLFVPIGFGGRVATRCQSWRRTHHWPCRLRGGFRHQLGSPFLSGTGLHRRG